MENTIKKASDGTYLINPSGSWTEDESKAGKFQGGLASGLVLKLKMIFPKDDFIIIPIVEETEKVKPAKKKVKK